MAMLDSLYGNLPGLGGAEAAKADKDAEAAPAAGEGKSGGDDMFSAPAAGPRQPEPAPSAPAAPAAKPDPAPAPLPQAFSAAKLMMPPVRKKAEPAKGGRPMPTLDIQKLQEEKAALMRQRAEAASKPTPAAPTPAAASSAADEGPSPASGSSAAVAMPAASALSAAAASNLYGSPDEEYDPAKPNDYDEFCRRRMRQKAEEEMERRRQETLARQQQAAKPPEPKEDDFATKMMKKMGWKEGGGLGKDGQGIANPLVLKKTDQRSGVIEQASAKREATAQAPGQPDAKQAKAAPTFNRPPTKVLLLNNMVGAGEVDEDLEEETAEEAGKYGKLKRCVVKEIKGAPDKEAVRIFLHFEQIESATKALVDMNGRYFGGRVVKAQFYDEALFEQGDLSK